MAEHVHIRNLCKTFPGGNLAMDDVSLAIEPGELFFLLGPSGCGKTTLLRSIAGFCIPDGGSVHIGERDVTRLAPHLRDTGMVFQSYALWPHMTLRQNVAFGLDMRKLPTAEKRRRTDEALAMVRMLDRAETKPNALSGGQQQRVALARALVIHPRCLLLDEPLSNLDAKLRLEMRQEIRSICKQAGITAIYVTHDQKEALSVADRLAILNGGRVQQVGSPSDVYRRPSSVFVAGFIGETNVIDGTVVSDGLGVISVDSPIGPLQSTVRTDGARTAGAAVCISIRPEAIHLGEPPAGMRNRLQGTRRHSIYLGELAQHEIVVGASTVLKVSEMNPRTTADGGTIPLWIDPEDVVLLPPATGAP